jgi:DNA-binding MarR family transcriptional regulator
MPGSSPTHAAPQAGKGRRRHSPLDDRLVQYLVRAGARRERPLDAKHMAKVLAVPYTTVTAALRRLAAKGRVTERYIVNSFRTSYCHEYIVSLMVNGRAIASTHKKRRERLAKLVGAGLRDGGAQELFIEELIDGLAGNRAYRDHLIIRDAVILHGAPERDIELRVLTDDALFSLGRWIRNELAANPCVRRVHTMTVGFRFSCNGYSGQDLNCDAAGCSTAPDALG